MGKEFESPDLGLTSRLSMATLISPDLRIMELNVWSLLRRRLHVMVFKVAIVKNWCTS